MESRIPLKLNQGNWPSSRFGEPMLLCCGGKLEVRLELQLVSQGTSGVALKGVKPSFVLQRRMWDCSQITTGESALISR